MHMNAGAPSALISDPHAPLGSPLGSLVNDEEGALVTQICAGAEAENAAVAGQRCRLIWRGCTEYCEQRRWREWQEI